MIGIGIVGTGRMGQLHATNFHGKVAGSQVMAVADEIWDRAQELGQKLNVKKVYKDYRNLLEDPRVDAIVICTPVLTHKQIILDALAAGKHILCEKPLTLTVEDAEDLYRAIEGSNVVFQLAFMRRFDEAFMVARDKIQEGVIGRPVFVRSTGRDPGLPPIPGWGADPDACGDIAFELCSHDYDSMQWLIDSDIINVYARAAILSSIEVAKKYGGKMINDTLVVLTEFANGALGSIDGLLNIKYGYDARVEVVGDEGSLFIGALENVDIMLARGDRHFAMPSAPSFIDRFAQAYVKEAEHFVNCVLNSRKPRVGILDGVKAVKVASAVNESLRTGAPVSLVGE
ncbi:MAG: Gfo/Idh/MocA family oxidoreductase [Thermoanaerobacteraceae bacterium]|nr:Gfo/Idh/MocA family oxidoreductase [Thermoanaerobacteraceae bacterium]